MAVTDDISLRAYEDGARSGLDELMPEVHLPDGYWELRTTKAASAAQYLLGLSKTEEYGNVVEIRRSLTELRGFMSIVPNPYEALLRAMGRLHSVEDPARSITSGVDGE